MRATYQESLGKTEFNWYLCTLCKPLKSDEVKGKVIMIRIAKLKSLAVLMLLHSPQSSGFPSATTIYSSGICGTISTEKPQPIMELSVKYHSSTASMISYMNYDN